MELTVVRWLCTDVGFAAGWPILSLLGIIMRISAIIALGIALALAGCGRDPGPKGERGRRGRPVRRARKAFRAWPALRAKPARKALRDPRARPARRVTKATRVMPRAAVACQVGPGGRRGKLRSQRDPGVGVLSGRRRGGWRKMRDAADGRPLLAQVRQLRSRDYEHRLRRASAHGWTCAARRCFGNRVVALRPFAVMVGSIACRHEPP